MKTTAILFFFITLTGIAFGQTKNADNYFFMYEGPNTAKFFKMGENVYLDTYLSDKARFGDREYFTSVRMYSWGDTDTAYYREDEHNYIHFDPASGSESIVLPKACEVGKKWLEADKSWSYEVIGINEKLKTPAKTYKGLIVIECVQLKNRDKNKDKIYHMFYAEGIGLVGSKNNGKLTSYLAEYKRGAKEGEAIGK